MSSEKMIAEEYAERRKTGHADLVKKIKSGKYLEVRYYFMYYAEAEFWEDDLSDILDIIDTLYEAGVSHTRAELLKMLVFLAIDLKSFAINWVLARENNELVIEAGFHKVFEKVVEITESDVRTSDEVLGYFYKTEAGRLTAEAVEVDEIKNEISELCGDSLVSFILKTVNSIRNSNIYDIAVKVKNHEFRMTLGNDYGEYLNNAIWMGISYATTNPPLVNMVWEIDRKVWMEKLRTAIDVEKDKSGSNEILLSDICTLGALIVVEKNCRLLRGIFYSTNGVEGYTCFQVNPENCNNAEKMVDEVHYVLRVLKKRLGGVPNVSFKLPGTSASLVAAQTLSNEGISLTITLEFGLFQAVEFARIFQAGTAITSNLVVMNGRLSFPVRDELLENDIEGAEEASRWAGVEVSRKLFRKLYSPLSEGGLGFDQRKIRIMNASLRIYGSDIPDISELIGSQIITIFPNVRRAWDSKRRNYVSETIRNRTPGKLLKVLKKSEIFRQAWWIEEDTDDSRPKQVLSLEEADNEAVLKWVPIKATLDQFREAYGELRNQVKELIKK